MYYSPLAILLAAHPSLRRLATLNTHTHTHTHTHVHVENMNRGCTQTQCLRACGAGDIYFVSTWRPYLFSNSTWRSLCQRQAFAARPLCFFGDDTQSNLLLYSIHTNDAITMIEVSTHDPSSIRERTISLNLPPRRAVHLGMSPSVP